MPRTVKLGPVHFQPPQRHQAFGGKQMAKCDG
jgi:hypothetical protein